MCFSSAYAQVGINTETPKATMDIVGKPTTPSHFDGLIAPRITGNQLRAKSYTSEQTGALVYATAADTAPAGQTVNVTSPGYYFFNGSVWMKLFTENIYTADGSLAGNRIVTQGSNTLKFTTDNTKVDAFNIDNNTFSVDALNNRIGISTNAPYGRLSNTSSIPLASNGVAPGPFQGLNWLGTPYDAYIAGFTNSYLDPAGIYKGHGLMVKVAGNDADTYAFDISQQTTATTPGNNIMTVKGDGSVGIKSRNNKGVLHIDALRNNENSGIISPSNQEDDFVVANDGTVGIGINAPQATLDVKGKPATTTSMDGIIAPRLTGAQLRAKNYTAAQTGALVYVTAADTAPAGQTAKVTVAGYYYFDGSVWQSTSTDTTNDAFVNNSASSTVELGSKSNGTTRNANTQFWINDSGKVGIDLAPSSPNATAELTIATDAGQALKMLPQDTTDPTGTTRMVIDNDLGRRLNIGITNSAGSFAGTITQGNTGFITTSGSDTNLVLGANNTPKVTIFNDGKMGIGSIFPSQPATASLDIDGGIRMRTVPTANGSLKSLYTDNSGNVVTNNTGKTIVDMIYSYKLGNNVQISSTGTWASTQRFVLPLNKTNSYTIPAGRSGLVQLFFGCWGDNATLSGSSNPSIEVQYSLDNGSTWTLLENVSQTFNPSSTIPFRFSLNYSTVYNFSAAASSSTVSFRLRAYNPDGTFAPAYIGWYLSSTYLLDN